MSGAGKSTLLGELARRGHRTVDTDYDDWVLPDAVVLLTAPLHVLLDRVASRSHNPYGTTEADGLEIRDFAETVELSLVG